LQITPPESLALKTGKNHDKPPHDAARKDYYDYLAAEISIADIEASRDLAFDDEPHYRSGGIRLAYNSEFDPGATGAKEGVLLEVGFDDTAPNAPIHISSWAYDRAIAADTDIIDNRAKSVPCYAPGYSFVEKLQTIATKYRNHKEHGDFPENFMRHYYDVYCLLKDESVRRFIGTDAYQAHKRKRFPRADHEIPLADNQAFLLADPEDFETFKKEYEGKEALYFQGQPAFEDVIGEIRRYLPEL